MKTSRLILAGLCLLALTGCDSDSGKKTTQKTPPNILLIIMDDVGVDQMASFGYGGSAQPLPSPLSGTFAGPAMPGIDAIAGQGIKFRNTWSMPECSPGRSVLMTGRYPLRNNIFQAIGPNDLANSQLSPYEVTLPKLLKNAGYESGMFGKFHLAGPENNMAENNTPDQLGWDYFYGWTGGLPASIDTTTGGVYDEGRWSCGFYPHHFAGACYFPDGRCQDMPAASLDEDANGLQCLEQGGIFVRGFDVPEDHDGLNGYQTCADPLPEGMTLDFEKQNAYYVSPLVIIDHGVKEEVPLTDARARGYRTTIETNAAIDWIQSRKDKTPWMATVSYSSAHTPWQHAPKALAPITAQTDLSANVLDCTNALHGRIIQDQMTEAMDTEFGRLLLETGLASRAEDGSLNFNPDSNTLVIIVGDNGTLGNAVKLPFDLTRAKGTVYQTGVWVPLIIAGTDVAEPGTVEHMVNVTDLYRLIGEVAGLDVDALVPRTVDAEPMLAYLHNPAQEESIRQYNFAQSALNLQKDGGRNGPCVIASLCSHIPVSKSVCEDNGGVWWGQGADDADAVAAIHSLDPGLDGLDICWQVNQALYKHDAASYDTNHKTIGSTRALTVRNAQYKLVRNEITDYDIGTDGAVTVQTEELYAINQDAPMPLLDTEGGDLLVVGEGALDATQRNNLLLLQAELARILASQLACPGDGNDDGKVDQADLDEFDRITVTEGWSGSSTYDFNLDGVTDAADRAVIEANPGACP